MYHPPPEETHGAPFPLKIYFHANLLSVSPSQQYWGGLPDLRVLNINSCCSLTGPTAHSGTVPRLSRPFSSAATNHSHQPSHTAPYSSGTFFLRVTLGVLGNPLDNNCRPPPWPTSPPSSLSGNLITAGVSGWDFRLSQRLLEITHDA